MKDDDRLLAYIQGRLGADERAALDAELAQNADLQAELAMMQGVRESIAEDTTSTEDEVLAGWNRVSASIDAEQTGSPANDNWPRTLLQVAAVAAFSIIAWQFAAAPFFAPSEEAGFVVASASDQPHVLQVGFAGTATLDEVAGLLRAAGGRVIDGPGATGVFMVQFEDDAARDAAQARFSDSPDLVLLSALP